MTLEQVIQKAIEGGFELGKYGNETRVFKFRGFFVSGNKIEVSTEVSDYEDRYNPKKDCDFWVHFTQITSDPNFWIALGKSLGLNGNGPLGTTFEIGNDKGPAWRNMWHKFTDHLASGGTPSDFFKSLS